MRVLIVEDEQVLRDQLALRFKNEGYAIDIAVDGEEALFRGIEYPIDLAVVDLGLPKISGIEVIKRWRADGKRFPILILTARGRWQEKVEGLEAGADDYVVKPVHLEELIARAKALLRRAAGWAGSVLQCGPLEFDLSTQAVKLHGDMIELTAYEYKVLEYMVLHAGQVVSKTELTEHIYEEDNDKDSNVIEVFMRRLRRKLDPNGELNPIETLRGRGYRFTLAANKS